MGNLWEEIKGMLTSPLGKTTVSPSTVFVIVGLVGVSIVLWNSVIHTAIHVGKEI